MSSALEQKIRATTEGFVSSFSGKWQFDATLKYRAPECKHTMLPSTLGIEPMNNDEFAAHLAGVAPMIKDGKMIIKELIIAEKEKRAVCYSALDAVSLAGDYHNEYVWMLRFDDSGEKITEIKEFLDSKATSEIRGRIAEMREQGKI